MSCRRVPLVTKDQQEINVLMKANTRFDVAQTAIYREQICKSQQESWVTLNQRWRLSPLCPLTQRDIQCNVEKPEERVENILKTLNTLLASVLGHIFQTRSTSHFYSSTKHALKALTEGVRQELREAKSHIRVTSISPGLVETEFAYQFNNNDREKAAEMYASIKCLQAADIANAVVYVLGTPRHVQVGELLIRPTEQIN
ncbi:hypothetical protein NDU88_002394 [Pleurodeles waltl]|uniref:Dehydrogenase/reductase SDR family member 11 n=1 Tax=Pleurodeles waltl TaxID=8319 RepID=A0AAV7U950_PLEWA|nr:hypothetical protein NDU88_002394 [Pleurodeles waltl]